MRSSRGFALSRPKELLIHHTHNDRIRAVRRGEILRSPDAGVMAEGEAGAGGLILIRCEVLVLLNVVSERITEGVKLAGPNLLTGCTRCTGEGDAKAAILEGPREGAGGVCVGGA